ncbi:MAG: hypothetical protein IIT53_16560 [Fibrobacter sp.]|jgi:hypothetical protein|nr:hypothetical protein [Fibrobacter sp.]
MNHSYLFIKPILALLSLFAAACTQIVYDEGYEANIQRAATVDSVKVTFSDGSNILEQRTIGPEYGSVEIKSSKERTGRFMFTVGVYCSGASDWVYVVPQPIIVESGTRVFVKNTTPIDCEHIANKNVIYEITPKSIFDD